MWMRIKNCIRGQRSRYTFQKLKVFCNIIVASVYHSRDEAHKSFGEDRLLFLELRAYCESERILPSRLIRSFCPPKNSSTRVANGGAIFESFKGAKRNESAEKIKLDMTDPPVT